MPATAKPKKRGRSAKGPAPEPPRAITARALLAELQRQADPKRAAHARRFFKTGPGEYGEGDRFLGVRVPQVRQIAKTHVLRVSHEQVLALLTSTLHEARLLALILWTLQFQRGDEAVRDRIYRSYLKNTRHINNWDLVDVSAHKIVGPRLHTHAPARADVLRLTCSKNLWERRIAAIATLREVSEGRLRLPLEVAEALLFDAEDLIHKAVGWLLREVGRRDRAAENAFLERHAARMPRTALRYAIERHPKAEREFFLRLGR